MVSTAAACCAAFYAQDWVQAVLGESFHPGGLELSERMVDALQLRPSARVVDLACGVGGTSVALARRGHDVVGIDVGAHNLDKARAAARAADVQVRFVEADVASLPLPDQSADAVVVECAVSTFEDQPAVAREIRRVLRPAGRLAVSDMVIESALPPALMSAAGSWVCLQGALDRNGYERLFAEVGLKTDAVVDESDALRSLVLDLKRKLVMAGLGAMAGALQAMSLDVEQARALLDQASAAIARGDLRYARMTLQPC